MRTLTAGMQTAVAAQTGEIAYLFQIDSSGGSVRLATSPVNISWNSQTWEGIGGTLAFSAVEETPDMSGQGVELTLSGVNQTIISVLLNNQFRGYEVRIWLAHFASTGTIVSSPLEIFRGRQLSDYRITETRRENDQPGTVSVKTKVQSRLAVLLNAQPVLTSEVSHNDMLKRAGVATGDTFFRNVPAIAGPSLDWGGRDIKKDVEKIKRFIRNLPP